MNLFLYSFVSGAAFLLGFLLLFHPLRQNIIANRWLSLFTFIIGSAFISIYMIRTGTADENMLVFKALNCFQFLLAPSLYISILYFVKPSKKFSIRHTVHLLPFVIYSVAEFFWEPLQASVSTHRLFDFNSEVSFLVRDILPFLTLFYLIRCYFILRKHQAKLKLISSEISSIDLRWLMQFLFIFLMAILTWINDALLDIAFVSSATPFIYAISIFFLAYFAIQQKTIFAFKKNEILEITDLLESKNTDTSISSPRTQLGETSEAAIINPEQVKEMGNPKVKRMSTEQIPVMSERLRALMETEKLYLDNELSLPVVAEKLGISIHQASYLINESTNDNFYNYVNRFRIEEAKKLLLSMEASRLNMLGVAFSAGFNSKTTFNTTFKRIVGMSPTQYLKSQKK